MVSLLFVFLKFFFNNTAVYLRPENDRAISFIKLNFPKKVTSGGFEIKEYHPVSKDFERDLEQEVEKKIRMIGAWSPLGQQVVNRGAK